MAADPEEETARLAQLNQLMAAILSRSSRCTCRIVPFGPVGQTYPRLFIDLESGTSAPSVEKKMRERGIYIGRDGDGTLYISPLNLTQDEAKTVADTLLELIMEE